MLLSYCEREAGNKVNAIKSSLLSVNFIFEINTIFYKHCFWKTKTNLTGNGTSCVRLNCLISFVIPVSSLKMSEKIKMADSLQAYEIRP